jgi:hypothetical protein
LLSNQEESTSPAETGGVLSRRRNAVTTTPLARAGVSVQKEIQEVGERVAEYQRRQRKEKPLAAAEPRVPEGRVYPTDVPEEKFMRRNVEARVWRFGKGLKTEFRIELVRYHSRFDKQEEAWMLRFEDIASAHRAMLAAKDYVRKEEKRSGKKRSWWE